MLYEALDWLAQAVSKPGLGADAPALTGKHNRRQWTLLSNLIYTDGTSWARYETSVLCCAVHDVEGVDSGVYYYDPPSTR